MNPRVMLCFRFSEGEALISNRLMVANALSVGCGPLEESSWSKICKLDRPCLFLSGVIPPPPSVGHGDYGRLLFLYSYAGHTSASPILSHGQHYVADGPRLSVFRLLRTGTMSTSHSSLRICSFFVSDSPWLPGLHDIRAMPLHFRFPPPLHPKVTLPTSSILNTPSLSIFLLSQLQNVARALPNP